MPQPQTFTRQHAIGGAIGVVVLVFALLYRFFPQALHVAPPNAAPAPVAANPAPGAQNTKPLALIPAESELVAGPPISLAPSDVIAQRARGHALAEGAHRADTPVGKLLSEADQVALHGKLTGADADTAISLVLQAATLDAKDAHVRAALSGLHTRLFAEAQQALAANDVDTARADLAALKRLPDAANDAQELSVRIAAANEVRPLLEQAASLMQQGRMEGAGDTNALALYRKVLTLDPENAVARQGLQQVQNAALDRALSAAAQSDDSKADAALTDAAAILPSAFALSQTRARITNMRDQRGAGLLAQAQSALDAGNADLALKLTQQAQALDDNAQVRAFLLRVNDARLYANYRPGQVISDHYLDIIGHAPPMVVLPLGTFAMGASAGERGNVAAEQPQHAITIPHPFAMARSEITVAQFREFVRASGYTPESDRAGGASVYDESSGRMQMQASADWRDDYAGKPARDDDPAVNISWNDAQAYAQWLSQRTGKTYRLPSEAEFEYAERGGTATPYWWGSGIPKAKVENLTGSGDRSPTHRTWSNAFRNYSDGYWGPAPAMSFAANPFGLYDIDGNVSEWVEDCWHENYTRAPLTGGAWVNPGCAQRVIRGGSWGSAPEQDRSAYRQAASADARSGRVGFRVVRDL